MTSKYECDADARDSPQLPALQRIRSKSHVTSQLTWTRRPHRHPQHLTTLSLRRSGKTARYGKCMYSRTLSVPQAPLCFDCITASVMGSAYFDSFSPPWQTDRRRHRRIHLCRCDAPPTASPACAQVPVADSVHCRSGNTAPTRRSHCFH